jgi:phytanoyl-CoA hydroxylase
LYAIDDHAWARGVNCPQVDREVSFVGSPAGCERDDLPKEARRMGTKWDLENLDQSFQEQGYVVLRQFFDASKVIEINQRIERYIATILPDLPKEEAFYEDLDDASTLMRLQGMEDKDSYFGELYEHPDLLALARTFMGDGFVPQTAQWFTKPPRVGSETPPHQDGFYFKLEPNEAVTLWLALDRVDQENGCIRFLPASHRRGMRPHQLSNVIGFSQGLTDYGSADLAAEIPVTLEPGDVTAHHCMTVHRADANKSERPRRALGFVFHAAGAKKNLDLAQEQQKQIMETWKRDGKI